MKNYLQQLSEGLVNPPKNNDYFSKLGAFLRGEIAENIEVKSNPDDGFKSEIPSLLKKGYSSDDIVSAIDQHQGISDRDSLKQFLVDFQSGQPKFNPVVGEQGKKVIEKTVQGAQELAEASLSSMNLPGDVTTEKLSTTKFAPLAGAIGLGINLLTPGPGEFAKGSKLFAKGLNKDIEIIQDFGSTVKAKDLKTGREVTIGKKDLYKKTDEEVFGGFNDLTTKVLDRLKGKSVTSKQEILDFTNMPELKQAERDLIRRISEDYKDKIPVQEFANKVKTELLPLTRQDVGRMSRYENISLPRELRGPVANYGEHIYESPIKTSAGDVHFSGAGMAKENYFAHTRIEDLPDKTTRRVIEAQSDLFQKGRLEAENNKLIPETIDYTSGERKVTPQYREDRTAELSKLEPYENNWMPRIVREEVKQAAKDGKTKLQFPTGETAMKIEGLGGESNNWANSEINHTLTKDEVFIGNEITNDSGNSWWVITKDYGDGKFQAVQKDVFERVAEDSGKYPSPDDAIQALKEDAFPRSDIQTDVESFDISGKVDTSNPIYRFYEKEVGKFLTNKFGAKLVTDPQGVKWWEVAVDREKAKLPVEAFGAAPFIMGQNKQSTQQEKLD